MIIEISDSDIIAVVILCGPLVVAYLLNKVLVRLHNIVINRQEEQINKKLV